MYYLELILWIILWVIFTAIGQIEKRGFVFGFLSGMWMLFMGVFIYLDGIQIQTGMLRNVSAPGNITITYLYSDLVYPHGSYAMIWGFVFFTVSIYVMWLSFSKMREGIQKR